MRRKARIAVVLATGLLSGFISGAAAMNSLVAYRIDNYLARIGTLENTLSDRENRLIKLEESLNAISREKYILKDVEVNLAYDGDELDRIEFEKHIKEKYSHLIGKEVSKIDAELVAEVVDKRIFVTESKKYKLHLDRLLLSETMKIWITTSPFEE